MSQEFHVVKCFSCLCFQGQQVKKVKKWTCKLCGEKQSVLKEFGRGSGADCRRHVQKLNAMRGAMLEESDTRSPWKQEDEAGSEERQDDQVRTQVGHTQVSRWSKYLDPPKEDDDALTNIQHFDRKWGKGDEGDDSRTLEQIQHGRTSSSQPDNTPTNQTDPPSSKTTVTIRACDFQDGGFQLVSGRSVHDGRVAMTEAPALTWPRPLLHGTSMFESEEDFDVTFDL
ncbi:MRN complex-interacting protein [Dunckerocampus dactyliophorus]|uniref:MRN complex-interacting protein n=1 Tax=Dunckerocampus dactyliophorus TaxID=161453 RepID=UPI00240755B4|nr:MRN complex-interacting protein [Dunckerocampus dactyliophorus]